MVPSYLKLSKREFEKRAESARKLLDPCQVCPRKCGVDRILRQAQDKPFGQAQGFCRMGSMPVISTYHPHFGEERCLVGTGGSGTIFFTSCNLACVFCQNWEISQAKIGEETTVENLAEMMISLQNMGCHNINLVSPTIWVPQILAALPLTVEMGLHLPFVYNTGGYDSVEILKLLDGIIDIYMPDIKYSDSKIAAKYSLVPNYWEVVQSAVLEMYRQVGDLIIDDSGLAVKGLLIRHLVLPGGLAGTKKVMEFIASLSKGSYVNIMDQYYPTNKAHLYPEINHPITQKEYLQAVEFAKKVGLHRFN